MADTRRRVGSREERLAQATAQHSAEVIAAMTPAERKRRMKALRGRISPYAGVPTLEAAGSDLLKLLQLVGAEFVRRYYPDANQVAFHVTKYDDGMMVDYSLLVPMATTGRKPR